MKKLLVYFWKGWLSTENMTDPAWLILWINSVKEAEKEGCQLVVFKVPLNKTNTLADPEIVQEIEFLLQTKYPERCKKNIL